MSDISLVPYLFFNGNCQEAMEFYKSVFGGELSVQTVGDLPKDAPAMPGSKPNDVMNAQLKGPINLMGSDSSQASDETKKVELCLGGKDEAKMRQIFDALSVGGEIKMPLEKQFWGDTFGSLRDKYRVDWLMNVESQA